jgi:hypothetical protein
MLKALWDKAKPYLEPLIRRKSVGGLNESVLEADEKKKGKKKDGDVLQPDPPAGGVMLAADLPPASAAPVVKTERPADMSREVPFIREPQPVAAAPPPQVEGIPRQYQSIRQHISAGQVHLHDDDNKLKVSIPVAEWYVIVRQLKTMTPYTYVDTDFNCTALFRPFMHNGYFEVAIEMQPVTVGDRFKQLASLIKR